MIASGGDDLVDFLVVIVAFQGVIFGSMLIASMLRGMLEGPFRQIHHGRMPNNLGPFPSD